MISSPITREEFTLSFQGDAVDNHEIDVNVLVDSLLAMKNLAERTNAILHGKQAEMYVKVKGGFEAGSFEFSMLFEWCAACAPVIIPGVTAAAAFVAPVLTTIVHTINLSKMLRGGKPKIISSGAETSTVRNSVGEEATFNNCVINVYSNAATRQDLARLAAPLGAGLRAVEMRSPDIADSVTLQEEDKPFFAPIDGDRIEENTKTCDLELLTPNLDGKSTGWRFYDPEESCEFTANISDEDFLENVRSGHCAFVRGTGLHVTIFTTKKIVSQRKRTERTITEVLSIDRPHKQE